MLRSKQVLAFALGAALALASVARADGPTTDTVAPAPVSQASSGAMKVYVTEVVGLVQVRDAADQPWKPATVKMILTEGAELRTGPHSSVTCVIPPDQTFTLDRLGTVRVAEAAQHGNKITTDLMMKYGRTRYDIEAAGLEHEAAITSPSSTLAVRGTRVSLFDQPPFKPVGISYTGRAQFSAHGHTYFVGHKDGSVTRITAGKDGPTETALDQTVVDPAYADARTQADANLIASEIAKGATLSFDSFANIPVITGGRPFYDSELPSNLPGTLNFVVRWTANTTLDLEVASNHGDPNNFSIAFNTASDFLFPGFGYQNSSSGGHIPFADHGGPMGGEEFAYWGSNYPTGIYGIAATNVGNVATSATFNVFLNGQSVLMYYFTPSFELVKSTQETTIIAPGANSAAIVPIPGSPALASVTADDPNGNPNPGITPSSFSPAQIKAALRSINPTSNTKASTIAGKR